MASFMISTLECFQSNLGDHFSDVIWIAHVHDITENHLLDVESEERERRCGLPESGRLSSGNFMQPEQIQVRASR